MSNNKNETDIYIKILQSSIQNITENLLNIVSASDLKIITIESMTGGGIINVLTNVPGYSNHIYGSLVVYHNDAKNELLGNFDESVYSKNYAKKMCSDALSKYTADIALSITGNADPSDPLSDDYTSVFYCGIGINKTSDNTIIVISRKFILKKPILLAHKINNIERRELVKIMAIKKVLSYLYKTLSN